MGFSVVMVDAGGGRPRLPQRRIDVDRLEPLTPGNCPIAPIPDLPTLVPERGSSTPKLPFAARETSATHDPNSTLREEPCELPGWA